MNQPDFLTDIHLLLLQDLDPQLIKNMFWGVSMIIERCPDLSAQEAQDTLQYLLYLQSEAATVSA